MKHKHDNENTVLIVGKSGPAFSRQADPSYTEVFALDAEGDVTWRRVPHWSNRAEALGFAMQSAAFKGRRS